MKIKTWVISGLVYLTIVVVGYAVITGNSVIDGGDHGEHEAQAAEIEEENDMNEHAHHNHHGSTESEVEVIVDQNDQQITVTVQDADGNAPALAVHHEKEMHMIAVSNDLATYHHLHPESVEDGVYKVDHSFAPGTYRIFVDISPEHLGYKPEPIDVQVGDVMTSEANLTPDADLVKSVDGKEVELEIDGLQSGDVTTLTFNSEEQDTLEPYLGALGHVVVIDEAGEQFIHVHPVADDETVFEAHFDQPGNYKLWAEFKFEDAGVIAFPYVIDVQ
ncbi:hypothetical protein ACE1TF_12120 [Geomicrobium sp. JSM 1781026]|uniref:hypothetical protein n=1 Tax=Geomicrobium sp. JSM 1781026 TaxID=3344580 RepID=UPI0035C1704C